jgi:hypothetical protein
MQNANNILMVAAKEEDFVIICMLNLYLNHLKRICSLKCICNIHNIVKNLNNKVMINIKKEIEEEEIDKEMIEIMIEIEEMIEVIEEIEEIEEIEVTEIEMIEEIEIMIEIEIEKIKKSTNKNKDKDLEIKDLNLKIEKIKKLKKDNLNKIEILNKDVI